MFEQKAIIIRARRGENNLDELNSFLRDGWRIKLVSPMGTGGQTASAWALVVLERER